MSIFVSSQDYVLMTTDCVQVSCTIHGHQYKMWCKRDNNEKANKAITAGKQIIEELVNKNKVLQFDKILFMALVDTLVSIQNNNNEISNKQKSENIENDKVNIDELNALIRQKENEIKSLEMQLEKAEKIRLKTIEDLEKLKLKLQECNEKLVLNEESE